MLYTLLYWHELDMLLDANHPPPRTPTSAVLTVLPPGGPPDWGSCGYSTRTAHRTHTEGNTCKLQAPQSKGT